MIDGFQRVLDQIRAIADTEAEKGRLFERLMRTFFQQDPLYRQRFSHRRWEKILSLSSRTGFSRLLVPWSAKPCTFSITRMLILAETGRRLENHEL